MRKQTGSFLLRRTSPAKSDAAVEALSSLRTRGFSFSFYCRRITGGGGVAVSRGKKTETAEERRVEKVAGEAARKNNEGRGDDQEVLVTLPHTESLISSVSTSMLMLAVVFAF